MHIYNREKAKTIEKFLKHLLQNGQGVRFGESTVISTKVHANDSSRPGEIQIITDMDAGQLYLKAPQPDQYWHIDVFHQHAKINPVILGRKIWEGIKEYLLPLKKESFDMKEDQWVQIQIAFARNILVFTTLGSGDVYDLASNRVDDSSHLIENHVHILAKIPEGYHDYIINLVDAVETSIIRQSYEIRKVERIIHTQRTTEEDDAISIATPPQLSEALARLFKSNRKSHAVIRLASALGSIEDAAQFLEAMKPTKNLYLGQFFKKHNDLQHTIQDLIEKKIIKKTAVFYQLTSEGKEFYAYLKDHQKELEAQLRKAIRKRSSVSPQFMCLYNSRLKAKKRNLTNKRKVIEPRNDIWMSDLAIPETIVRAAARSYLQGQSGISIEKEDMRVYGKKSYAPIDTCLLIDCSGSMVGEKIRAVSYLAEHLLLTSREKVGVVTFQEMTAQTVVPFTKNYRKLQSGLSSIMPEGLTPLATGIVQSLAEISRSKARNPLLVLITDGLPNYPLWSTNAQEDALEAARKIAQEKIRFTCIGLASDEKFLRELVKEGQGNLYLLEDLERNQMVDIVSGEWQQFRKAGN